MQRLYVLYDARCGLCSRMRLWAQERPAYVELTFVPAGSPRAVKLLPAAYREELVVVSDEGAVYRDTNAWIMCLYALVEFREWSFRLARPSLLPFARQAFKVVSENRKLFSQWFRLLSDDQVAELLRAEAVSMCAVPGAR